MLFLAFVSRNRLLVATKKGLDEAMVDRAGLESLAGVAMFDAYLRPTPRMALVTDGVVVLVGEDRCQLIVLAPFEWEYDTKIWSFDVMCALDGGLCHELGQQPARQVQEPGDSALEVRNELPTPYRISVRYQTAALGRV